MSQVGEPVKYSVPMGCLSTVWSSGESRVGALESRVGIFDGRTELSVP